ncbi:MAG: hypothetical protein V8T87_09660 [Victivallales bacterium]
MLRTDQLHDLSSGDGAAAFLSHQGVSPEKIRKAAGLLEQGYEKLTGFESENNGYEWFGGDPGHEALTAYGLMQFHEMKEIMPVDRSMLELYGKVAVEQT